MEFIIRFWTINILLLVGLSLFPALRTRSWKRFFLSVFLSAVGLLIPLFVFLISTFLVPDWKGGCHHGWLDCFHAGKLALTPLVLWACGAFYIVQVLKPEQKPRTWVELGLIVGAVVSTVCLIIGLVIHAFHSDMAWWLLVPLYISVWYLVLCVRAIRTSGLRPFAYLVTLAGTIPFWVMTVFLTKKHYMSLPDKPPDCFVVTAALNGHERIVGPFLNLERFGVSRVANSQLATFWRFERFWALHSQRTHRVFRWFYNLLGPHIAARVNSPFSADLVYFFLKPFEAFAALVVRFHEYKRRRTTGCTGVSHSVHRIRKL